MTFLRADASDFLAFGAICLALFALVAWVA